MDNFIELMEYNALANILIMNQVNHLSRETILRKKYDRAILMLKALLHLLKVDWVWFDLWKGQAIRDYPQFWDQLPLTILKKRE